MLARLQVRRVVRIVTCAAVWLVPLTPRLHAEEVKQDLGSILQDAADLSLAAEGRALKGNVLTVSQLQISIGEGVAIPVRSAAGNLYGLYFSGSGGWRYAAKDPAEQTTIRTNAERMAPSLRRTPDGVGDMFKSALVLFSEPLWKEQWDPDAPGEPAAVPEGAPAAFADVLRLVRSSWPEFEFRFAAARLNGRGRFVYAEFLGGVERVGYVFDDVGSSQELLFNFRKLADYNVRFIQRLAKRSFTRGGSNAPPSPVLTHVEIAIATADNKHGTIRSDVTLAVSRSEGARLLSLDLLNNRDPDSAAWDSKKNRLTVTRVADADGRDLPFAHRYGELIIEIPPLTGPEAQVRLRVETEGEVFVDWNGRHDDSYFIFLDEAWFPQAGHWSNEQFTYDLTIRTKKPWRPVASGTQISLSESPESFELHSRSDKKSRVIAVLAGKYVVREEKFEGLTVRVHAYAMARKNVLDNLPKLTAGFVRFYTEMLGPMQENEIDIVEVPEYGFGVSPSGLILLTTEAYKPQYEWASYFVGGINSRLAHEVAHQWFGHRAVPAGDRDDWLSESLAEYFSGLAMGAMAADKPGLVGFPQMLAAWRGEATVCADVGAIAMVNTLGGENAFRDRVCLLYNRGPLVMHMLRTLVGNERFVKATRTFLERANAGPASTEDYSKAISEVVQGDMRWFFDDWIRRGGTPEVVVRHQVDPAGKAFRLHGTIEEHAPADGFKRMYVPLILRYKDRTDVRLVFVDKTPVTFEFELAEKPAKLEVDPSGNNLVRYK